MSVKQQVDGEFKQLMEQQEPDEEENNHQVIRATYRIFYHQDRFQMEDLYKSMYIQNTARNNIVDFLQYPHINFLQSISLEKTPHSSPKF